MLSPPNNAADASVVIFCLDTSGSMCVTVEIPESQAQWKKLRVNREKKGEKADVYMSRLQCMQVYSNLYCYVRNLMRPGSSIRKYNTTSGKASSSQGNPHNI